MIQLEYLKKFFPDYIGESPSHQKYIVKEYLQLLILDYLATTPYIRKIVFIGGTNLRLTKGIDRFSEDLDFDCKDFSHEEFLVMTDGIVSFLNRFGFKVETRDKPNEKLKAYRRNLYFPELLFEMGLSGYRNERFLIKVEIQDQRINYKQIMVPIKGCGFYFKIPVPVDEIICAMKVSALISRQKGRDFYDTMFLMGQTTPDYHFLSLSNGVKNQEELKIAFQNVISKVDLLHKAKDFVHLVFQKRSAEKILLFEEFVNGL